MPTDHVSPFAPKSLIDPPAMAGVGISAIEAGIRYQGRTDLLLMTFPAGTSVAGVLTQSKTRSAPVEWCAKQLQHGQARALVVNSGNANAFTGKRGFEAARITAEAAAAACDCRPEDVMLASTGVIGEPMDANKFSDKLSGMVANADAGRWQDAAQAIMTTDTYAKLASEVVSIDGQDVTLTGIAKGAGMIAPDMATMLSFIVTDAPIAQPLLQKLVSQHVGSTYNSITVDSDTSTSDTLLVFATNELASKGFAAMTESSDPRLTKFSDALHRIMRELAHAIVKDGEGLTKFVTLNITGAETDAAAKTIGLAIANSPLVKTALAAEDPNWGRIVMAVGKSGEAADRDTLRISFGTHLVAEQGEVCDSYVEADVGDYMKNSEIEINVDIGVGSGQATVWTCDLTHDYVTINADYRT